ncbi:GDSL esterase/lipase At1g29670-like [Punica granatum]|uniref:GDSL esterase/lipase At1g29670-like n=1 Tax=Punica granatum TaxID=22663 RepID=A0A6P8DDJ5_PUNGR|nr:GDSL esterase/lipase At1g29670-like [Punica granatum]
MSSHLNNMRNLQGNIVTFSNQLKNHADTVSRITMMSGGNETSALSYLSKCLYHVMHGNNDFCGNYFRPKQYSSSCRYNAELFADLLIQTYTERIETLYQYGARKIMLDAVVPIGCAPSLQAKNPWTHTPFTERFHAPVRIYNDKLKSLVDDLNRDYTDSRFICLDDFCSFWNLVDRPSSNGLAVTNMACSGIGRNKGQVRCLPHLMPSRYRNLYVFWDPFSLTEAASLAVVKKLFDNDSWSSFTYPMSILQLAKL